MFLLEGDFSLNYLEQSAIDIDQKLKKLLDKFFSNNPELIKKFIGVTLGNKVFTKEIINIIKLINDNEYILLADAKIITKNLTIKNKTDNIVTHQDIVNVLDNYFVKNDNIIYLDEKYKKKSNYTNLVSVNEIDSNMFKGVLKSDVISPPITLDKVYSDVIDPSNEKSVCSIKIFKNNFIVNNDNISFVKLQFNELSKINIVNSKINKITLDYTLAEIEGSGCKLSDFIEIQAAKAPQSQIFTIKNFAFVINKSIDIKISDKTLTITPSATDTPTQIIQQISDFINNNFSNVTTSIETSGLYSSPEDDDGEHKISWYYDDVNFDTIDVELTSDNSSEHDIIVDWDSDNGKLTVTYASDGSDTLYPTIGELIDAVQSNSPLKVFISDSSYTEDDDYPYELAFSLEQTDNLLTVTSSKEELTYSIEPSDGFETKEQQSYVEGKHQQGKIEVVAFRRGYVYYIKIDDTKYSIDTTNDNNPDVTTAIELINKFKSLIEDDVNSKAIPSINNNVLTLTMKDYDSHTVTTSGEQDYQEPLPRSCVVKNDLKNYYFQDDVVTLYKKPISNNNLMSPLSINDIKKMVTNGIFYNKDAVSNVMLSNNAGEPLEVALNKDDFATLRDVGLLLEDAYNNLANDMFLREELRYIRYDNFKTNSEIRFSVESETLKDGVILAPKNKIMPIEQIYISKNMPIVDIERKLLGREQPYLLKIFEQFNLQSYYNRSYKEVRNLIVKDYNNKHSDLSNIGKNSYIKKAFYPLYYFSEDTKSILEPFIETEEFINMIDYVSTNIENRAKVKEKIFLTVTNFLKRESNYLSEQEKSLLDEINSVESFFAYINGKENNFKLLDELITYIKNLLFDIFIGQDDINLLSRMYYLLDVFNYSSEDIFQHLNSDVLKDTILEIGVADEEETVNNGLDGQEYDNYFSYKDLYIRNYKKILDEESTADLNKHYNGILYHEIAYSILDKTLLVGRINSDNQFEKFTLNKSLNDLTKNLNSTIFDDMYVKDILFNGYFPKSRGILLKKITSGYSKKIGTSVWSELVKTLYMQDESTIIGVRDSIASLRLTYNKYTSIDPRLLAMLLAFNNGLTYLCVAIYESFKRNNIDTKDYESKFNAYIGSIFTNDTTKTGIIGYNNFKYIISALGIEKIITDGQSLTDEEKNAVNDLFNRNDNYVFTYRNDKLVIKVDNSTQ